LLEGLGEEREKGRVEGGVWRGERDERGKIVTVRRRGKGGKERGTERGRGGKVEIERRKGSEEGETTREGWRAG